MNEILTVGKRQENKKGVITYLLNQSLTLLPADLLDIFETHSMARKKLKQNCRSSWRVSGRWSVTGRPV